MSAVRGQKDKLLTRLGFLTSLALMEIVLASQSPYRKHLLEQFGLRFTTARPDVDEDLLKQEGPADLRELTRHLAFQKASSLRAQFPQAIILGSDQIAEADGERLDKPGSPENAVRQLEKLQGRAHRLLTSLSIQSPTANFTFTDETTLHLRPLTTTEIAAYLALDQPWDCAGSYKIERAGLALIERMETNDPSSIQGLPLIALTTAFKKLGLPLTEIWRHHDHK